MEERIKNVMAQVLGVSPSEIGEDSSPKTLPKWDSLRHMNLIMALEDEFGIAFDENELASLTRFTAIRDAVREQSP